MRCCLNIFWVLTVFESLTVCQELKFWLSICYSIYVNIHMWQDVVYDVLNMNFSVKEVEVCEWQSLATKVMLGSVSVGNIILGLLFKWSSSGIYSSTMCWIWKNSLRYIVMHWGGFIGYYVSFRKMNFFSSLSYWRQTVLSVLFEKLALRFEQTYNEIVCLKQT